MERKVGLPRASHASESLSKEQGEIPLLIPSGPQESRVLRRAPDRHRAPVPPRESGSDGSWQLALITSLISPVGHRQLCPFSEGITGISLPGSVPRGALMRQEPKLPR